MPSQTFVRELEDVEAQDASLDTQDWVRIKAAVKVSVDHTRASAGPAPADLCLCLV